jgi:hypothetical protein
MWKKMKKIDTIGWTDGTIGASVGVLGTLRNKQNEDVTVGWSNVQFLDAPDEFSKISSTGWSDGLSEDTVGLFGTSF